MVDVVSAGFQLYPPRSHSRSNCFAFALLKRMSSPPPQRTLCVTLRYKSAPRKAINYTLIQQPTAETRRRAAMIKKTKRNPAPSKKPGFRSTSLAKWPDSLIDISDSLGDWRKMVVYRRENPAASQTQEIAAPGLNAVDSNCRLLASQKYMHQSVAISLRWFGKNLRADIDLLTHNRARAMIPREWARWKFISVPMKWSARRLAGGNVCWTNNENGRPMRVLLKFHRQIGGVQSELTFALIITRRRQRDNMMRVIKPRAGN